jgi:signal transduction histidine kinase
MVLDSQPLFDDLRGRLAALEGRTAALEGAQLDRIAAAQRVANLVSIVALVLALVVAVGSLPLLRHLITVPLRRLIGQVQAVAGGAYEEAIDVREPEELATIAQSVNRMRDAVVEHSEQLVRAQRDLVLREEHDRLATDLHDLTIQRIFALGLALTALARRNPELAGAVAPLIEETDRIVREVRTVIFDLGRAEISESLRGHVLDLAEESTRALGFAPHVEFAGPVDTLADTEMSAAVLAVLREALSNVARHARATRADIRLSVENGVLRLTVLDDGVGIDESATAGYGLGNMASRAARFGGTASVRKRADGDGTVLDWQAPVRAPVS